MELVPADLKVDFLGKAKFAFVLSAIMIAASAYIWFTTGDSKYGIDYQGGHEIVVKFNSDKVGSENIRKALNAKGVEGAIVQAFESVENEYSIRLGGGEFEGSDSAATVRNLVTDSLKAEYGESFEILKTDFVGPTIGKELRKKALIAILVGLIGMLIYITFRFELAFALGAVAALFHDVIVCMGLYLFFDFQINVATLAAALTIVGYSVNDTIIIFDRMREEIFRRKKFNLVELMNESIASTLSRTVITSLLTLFSALALLIFGGGAIQDLALFLVVGVITGTYSTIFIASPVALAWENYRSAKEGSEDSSVSVAA